MMNWLLILPITIPFLTAILSLLWWSRRRIQRALSVAGATALLASACALLVCIRLHGIQAVQMGGWPAPFGITLAADLLSAGLVVMTGIVGLAVVAFSLLDIDPERERFGYHPLIHILLMGVCGAFLTGDIFNLYVWFEVMLISSFVLLGLGGERPQLEGTIKYATLNLLSSALFLAAIGVLYGAVGALNMADLAQRIGTLKSTGLTTTLAVLFLLAFGIKAAIFPLFFWLPASYHTPPAPVSALFAGLLTKVGIYALVRIHTLIFASDSGSIQTLILVLAGLTMMSGVLGALVQQEMRRVLSFNLVSHIGYLIMGLGLFTPLALAGMIFYLLHDILVKTNLFLVSGAVYRLKGTYRLSDLGGLYELRPALSILFAIPALSLAGLPPLSGFWGKLALVEAGLDEKEYLLVAVALVAALLTLFSMAQLWSEIFWKDPPGRMEDDDGASPAEPSTRRWSALLVPIGVLGGLTLIMGIQPRLVFDFAASAAHQLANPTEYLRAVLGGSP